MALTPEQLARLQKIGSAYRALRRAANVAAFSGISTLSIGILSASCLALGGTLGDIAITLALCTFGAIELIGRQRLLSGAADSLRILAWNQLAFCTAVAVYCGVKIVTFSTNSLVSPEIRDLMAQLQGTTGTNLLDPQTERTLKLGYFAFYGAIAVISFVWQGRLALYYSRRREYLALFRSASEAEKQLLVQIAP